MLWKIFPLFLRLLCRCFPVNLIILFQDTFIREHLRANCLCNFEVHRTLNNQKKTNKQRLALCALLTMFTRKMFFSIRPCEKILHKKRKNKSEAGHRNDSIRPRLGTGDPIKSNDFITLLYIRMDISILLKRFLIVNKLVFLQLFVWTVRDNENSLI